MLDGEGGCKLDCLSALSDGVETDTIGVIREGSPAYPKGYVPGPRSTDSVDTLEDVPTLEYRNETSSVEYTERSPETPERSPVTRSPETPGRAGALSRLCNPA